MLGLGRSGLVLGIRTCIYIYNIQVCKYHDLEDPDVRLLHDAKNKGGPF